MAGFNAVFSMGQKALDRGIYRAKIMASMMLAIYVVLLVMFLDNFVPITPVIGLLIAFTLRVKPNSFDGEN